MLAVLLFAAGLYDYNQSAPLDVKATKTELREGIEVRDITFANTSGGRTAAYLVVPSKKGSHPAALMVHWYAPEEQDSNRTQYLGQAIELAKLGVISLLPETMWSEPKWFRTRKRDDDFDASIRSVKELRRGLDLLMAQPDVDKKRVGFVGHDFGAMYGVILITADKRPTLVRSAGIYQRDEPLVSLWSENAGAGPDSVHPETQAAGCNRASQPRFSRSCAVAVRND